MLRFGNLPGRSAMRSIALCLALSFALAPTPLLARESGKAKCVETALHTILENASPKVAVRSLEKISELRVATYNLLNLRESVGKFRYAADGTLVMVAPPKPTEVAHLKGKAEAIREINPDVLILQEVEGGLETLQKFADEELGGVYKAYLTGGNDSRGINIGFLLKNDLPLTVEMETHKNLKWLDPTRSDRPPAPLYSRDLPVLVLRTPDQAPTDKPLLVIFGNHSKSQRDRPGDPGSVILRKAQVEQTAALVASYQQKFGKDARIVLGGDFNTHIEASEMKGITRNGLSEGFQAARNQVAPEDRVTHTFHPRDGPRKLSQLDAFYVSPGLNKNVLRTWVYRYKDAQGTPLPLPRSYAQRELNPSDHFPLVMELDFQPVLRQFKAEQKRP